MFYAKQHSEDDSLWYVVNENEVVECDSCNEPLIFGTEAQAKHCAEHLNTRALLASIQEQLTEVTLILSEIVNNLPDNFDKNTKNNGGMN